MLDLGESWSQALAWVAASALTPLLAALDVAVAVREARAIAEPLLIAAIQVAIIACIFRPLESVVPAERWVDRRLTGVDRFATLLMVFGLLPLFSFLVLLPLGGLLSGSAGQGAPSGLKHWWPWLQQQPYVAFAIYYVIYDLTYYCMHRAQHAIPWWWALHSMHHSQRQMSCWANDRGSYPDAVLQALILASVGHALGVEASEFAWLSLLAELVQNFSHANVAIGFGPILDKLIVDPRFHRLHHMRVDPARPGLHNCNYGQVMPVWDILFGTSLYGEPARPTGVADPSVDADNGRGLLAMQWWTLKRFWAAVRRPSGWVPHEVQFGPDFAPVPVDHGTARAAELAPEDATARRRPV
jgi:sterol desaturase/sphingolipid hydroxylase (fatty acid hydroxylase superfamily)